MACVLLGLVVDRRRDAKERLQAALSDRNAKVVGYSLAALHELHDGELPGDILAVVADRTEIIEESFGSSRSNVTLAEFASTVLRSYEDEGA